MTQPSSEWKRSVKSEKGILCGADQTQEWLLPWWWERYRDHNDYPVTFCDFGMSESMRQWCKERGEVVSVTIDSDVVMKEDQLNPFFIEHGNSAYGERWFAAREQWFKKPFACLQSCYQKGIWIDVDCEILGSLEPLFSGLTVSADLAIVREYHKLHLPAFHEEVVYNSGMIVFKHGSSWARKWADAALTMNHLFLGDDQLLSHLIYQQKIPIQELSQIYNWRPALGLNPSIVIFHWAGVSGKEFIRNYKGLKSILTSHLEKHPK